MKKKDEMPVVHEEEFAVILPPLQKRLLSGFVGFNQTKTLSLFFHNKYAGTIETMQVDRSSKFSQIEKNLSLKIGMTFFYLHQNDRVLAANFTPEDKGLENGDIINITPVD
jgi:hypothetical protein